MNGILIKQKINRKKQTSILINGVLETYFKSFDAAKKQIQNVSGIRPLSDCKRIKLKKIHRGAFLKKP